MVNVYNEITKNAIKELKLKEHEAKCNSNENTKINQNYLEWQRNCDEKGPK
jgi:hypothetical protein